MLQKTKQIYVQLSGLKLSSQFTWSELSAMWITIGSLLSNASLSEFMASLYGPQVEVKSE